MSSPETNQFPKVNGTGELMRSQTVNESCNKQRFNVKIEETNKQPFGPKNSRSFKLNKQAFVHKNRKKLIKSQKNLRSLEVYISL